MLRKADDGVCVWLDGEVIIDKRRYAEGLTYSTGRMMRGGLHEGFRNNCLLHRK